MGLLDDAIREHLELKRRHGGDAGEIARLENEVLGSGADEGPRPAAATAPPVAAPPAPAPDVGTPVEAQPELVPERDLAPQREPEAEPEPPEGVPAAVPPEEEHDPQATVAFSLEERRAAETPPEPVEKAEEDEAAGEHDELEETPDFLQETPEHDRMWFEQKPPRDFDF